MDNQLPTPTPLLSSTDINSSGDSGDTNTADNTPTQPVVPTNAIFAPGITLNGQPLQSSSYGMGGTVGTNNTNKSTSSTPAKPTATGIANNPLVRNLQNIGDVVGGILGTPGDLIAGPGGNIVGAAAGRGIGEFLKEGIDDLFGGKVNGKKVGISGKEIAEQTGLGALSQAGGELLGGVGSKLAKGAASSGERLVAKSIFGGAPKADQLANDAVSTAKTITGYGIKAKDLPEALAQTSGADGFLSAATKRAMNLAGTVIDTTGLTGDKGLINKTSAYLDANNPGAGRTFKNLISLYLGKNIGKTIPASDVYDFMNNLESKAFTKGTRPDVQNALYGVARTLEDKLETARGLDQEVSGSIYNPNEIAAAKEISPKLASEMQGVKTIRQSRAIHAPFVKASNLLKSAADQAENVNAPGVTGGLRGMADLGELITGAGLHGFGRAAALGDMALRTPGVQRTAGELLQKPMQAVNFLSNKPALKSILKTITPQAISAINSSSTSNTATGPVSSATNTQINQAQSALTQATTGNGGTGGLTPQDFSAMMNEYGTTGMSRYMDYLQLTQPTLSSEQQTGITLAQNSLTQIQQLANLYDGAMSIGGTGKALSSLSKIPVVGGLLGQGVAEVEKNTKAGADIAAYNARKYDLARTVSKLASEGGQTGGMSSITAIEKLLPTLNDSPIEASTKFSSAVQSILSSAQSILAAPATNTPGQVTSFANASIPGSSLPGNIPNILESLNPSGLTGAAQ